ncbi:hypothetical protein BJ742DRAFT_773790 [Cladochytrium replicatum]|nr:hypothetical protein BJ742DRAFT_773790 [Cladochytrium replicatum]
MGSSKRKSTGTSTPASSAKAKATPASKKRDRSALERDGSSIPGTPVSTSDTPVTKKAKKQSSSSKREDSQLAGAGERIPGAKSGERPFSSISVYSPIMSALKTVTSTFMKSGVSRLIGPAMDIKAGKAAAAAAAAKPLDEIGGLASTASDDIDSEIKAVEEHAESGQKVGELHSTPANLLPNPAKAFGDVIVIHPGSRNLRIGRASDPFPVEVPHLIVRHILVPQSKAPAASQSNNAAVYDENVMDVDTQEDGKEPKTNAVGYSGPSVEPSKADPLVNLNPESVEPIAQDLKARMRAVKIRTLPNGATLASSYNSQVRPEVIMDHNDPYKIEWTDGSKCTAAMTGLKALRIPNLSPPAASSEMPPNANKRFVGPGGSNNYFTPVEINGSYNYRTYWPIQHGLLNVEDYSSLRACLGDIEYIWSKTLEEELGILQSEFKDHNVVLVVPDLFHRRMVKELISMLLVDMGFKGVVVQQESVCAALGAGISSVCVVDIGAQTTSVSCVEDGMCLCDTRINLRYGGDDLTRFFTSLMKKADFPYRELNVEKRLADWLLVDELKERICTVNEVDFTLNVFDFWVRAPNRPTTLYKVKIFDESVLAPMIFFYPQVINMPAKLWPLLMGETYFDESAYDPTESLYDFSSDLGTQATIAAASYGDLLAAIAVGKTFNFLPISLTTPPKIPTKPEKSTGKQAAAEEEIDPEEIADADADDGAEMDQDGAENHDIQDILDGITPLKDSGKRRRRPGAPIPVPMVTTRPAVTAEELANASAGYFPPTSDRAKENVFAPKNSVSAQEILKSASMPLDVAIATSISRYARLVSFTSSKDKDGDERVKKMVSCVLVVGGSSLVNGFPKLLQDRVQRALGTQLVMPSIQRHIMHGVSDYLRKANEWERTIKDKKLRAKARDQARASLLSSTREDRARKRGDKRKGGSKSKKKKSKGRRDDDDDDDDFDDEDELDEFNEDSFASGQLPEDVVAALAELDAQAEADASAPRTAEPKPYTEALQEIVRKALTPDTSAANSSGAAAGTGGTTSEKGNVIPPVKVVTSPRELDPRVLVWKGASVLARLDMTAEMWIGKREWYLGGIERVLGKMFFTL